VTNVSEHAPGELRLLRTTGDQMLTKPTILIVAALLSSCASQPVTRDSFTTVQPVQLSFEWPEGLETVLGPYLTCMSHGGYDASLTLAQEQQVFDSRHTGQCRFQMNDVFLKGDEILKKAGNSSVEERQSVLKKSVDEIDRMLRPHAV
jgi:hypothetical protein